MNPKIDEKKGLGILDFTRPIPLGEFLIFIENLKIKQELNGAFKTDIAVITNDNAVTINNKAVIDDLYPPLLYNYLSINQGLFFDSEGFKDFLAVNRENYGFIYPNEEEYNSRDYTFNSTKIVRDFYESKGNIPFLSVNEESETWAKNFLKEKNAGKLSAAVHLKNNPSAPGESNAGIKEWFEFFKACHDQKLPVKFFLIGNDKVNGEIRILPNVIICREEGSDIIKDLALVEFADIYMGMCSGPFQIALFNKRPYLVFKNPGHHKGEMIKEIGNEDRYPFAFENQKIFRKFETKKILMDEFTKIFNGLKKVKELEDKKEFENKKELNDKFENQDKDKKKKKKIKYRQLGNSDLKVSELCLGGNIFGYFTDLEETKKIIDYAFEQGINFIDTANVYGGGISESFIGEAIKGRREKFIIATKAGMRSDQKPENIFTREYILKSTDESLERLQTDYIDLYQIHNFDFLVPLEETLEALNQLVEKGKVRYIGCSNYTSPQLRKALALQFKNKFVSIQLPYNIINREIEEETLPLCNQANIGVLAYQALARGILTAKYKDSKNIHSNQRASVSPGLRAELTDELICFTNKLEEFAHYRGYSAAQLAIAWVLSRKEVGSVIIGVRNVEQLKGCLKAGEWKLSESELYQIKKMTEKYKERHKKEEHEKEEHK